MPDLYIGEFTRAYTFHYLANSRPLLPGEGKVAITGTARREDREFILFDLQVSPPRFSSSRQCASVPLPRDAMRRLAAAIHARRIITFAFCPRTVSYRRRYATLPLIPRTLRISRIFPSPPLPPPPPPRLPDDSVGVRSYYYPPRNNGCAMSFISRLHAGAIAKSLDRLLAQTLFSVVSYRERARARKHARTHERVRERKQVLLSLMKIVDCFEEFNKTL